MADLLPAPDPLTIRPMQTEEAEPVLAMMATLSRFERKTGFNIGAADLARWQADPSGQFSVLVAELSAPAQPKPLLVGYAACYMVPFMDDLRPAMMLKGLFVDPAHRASGIGRRLFRQVAELAASRHCGRLQWFVLHDNRPAQTFYRAMGASPDPDWQRWNYPMPAAPAIAAMD